MARPADVKRNREIIDLVEEGTHSYELIAKRLKISRNVIAGVMFRKNRKPKNRSGLGRRGCVHVPKYTAKNPEGRPSCA